MRVPYAFAIASAFALLGTASAQSITTHQYVARTAAPAARTGAVTAGNLTWQCTGSECRISGPWPQPAVGACIALAAQVGRIASYGRSGAMLDAAQLTQCNAQLPAAAAAAPTQQMRIQIDPNTARQAGTQARTPSQLGPMIVDVGAPPPSPVGTSRVAIEPGNTEADVTVHVLVPGGIRFFGVTPRLPAPALAPPSARIVSGRIDSPGVRLQASAPGATATPRSSATSEAPFYMRGVRSDVVLRVPVSLRDMPAETTGIVLTCQLYASRFVPFAPGIAPDGTPADLAVEAYRYQHISGGRADDHEVAYGGASAFIRNIGRFETTFDIPLQTRPFWQLRDARSYQCDVELRTGRTGGSDLAILATIAGPTSARAGFRPATGTTPMLKVEGNIQ